MNNENIRTFFEQNHAFFQRSWSSNPSIERNNIKNNIRSILIYISGNDMLRMISDIFFDYEICSLHSKYKQALFYFGKLFNEAKPKDKHKFLYPVRISGISRNAAITLNFNTTTYMWANCIYQNFRDKGGRKGLSKFYLVHIEDHMKTISTIAANRYLKKSKSNAYYRTTSILKAYESFPYKDKLNYSTFYKYIPEKFKKPHRISDLCDYCEKNKKNKKELLNFALERGYNGENEYYSIKEFLILTQTRQELLNLINIFNEIESTDFHLSIANRQRESYNFMRTNLEDDYILIDMDWKQKIMIGLSPRQPSNEYRNQESRTLFGFGIYYKENEEVKCINIDLISGITKNETGLEVINNFRFLRNLEIFKKIEKKKYIIWADTGTHFRCSEVIDYFFNELSREKIQICLNFFVEKHGKNSRDQHFSAVSNFIKQESMVKKIICSQDIADAINKNQTISNIKRERIKLTPVKTFAFVVSSNPLGFQQKTYRKIKNITNYYNFFNNDLNELRSVIVSDLRVSKLVEFEDSVSTVSGLNSDDQDFPVEKSVKESKLGNIVRKSKNLKKNLNSISKHITSYVNTSQELSELSTKSSTENSKNQFNFCKEECKGCSSFIRYRLSDLKNIKKKELIIELKNHNHPSSRKNIDNKNRTIKEAQNELRNHYLNNHKKRNNSISLDKFFCQKCNRNFSSINSLLMHKMRLKH